MLEEGKRTWRETQEPSRPKPRCLREAETSARSWREAGDAEGEGLRRGRWRELNAVGVARARYLPGRNGRARDQT